MIEKPKRPKQPSIQERQPPRTLQELINRYDLDNTKVYDFLDELVDNLKNKEETVDNDITELEQGQTDLQNQINIDTSYSTEETAIGTWIDGKTIYRKAIVITGTLSYNTPYSFGVNPDTVIRMNCLVNSNNGSAWRILPWLFVLNDSTLGQASWAGGFYYHNKSVYFQAGSNLLSSSKTVFIMEYTK